MEWRGVMKVSNLEYKRLTLDEITAISEEMISEVKNATTIQEVLYAREKYVKS